MAVDAELGAIIGGCVAGALVLIAITTVIVCLCCGKRRHRKDREQKKFHQLTPHTSPSHSQPSSLGHGGGPHPPHQHPHQPPHPPQDPRLPKVGSNGLWLGTPGIYAGTPSPAYYYGRPNSHHHAVQPAVLQRASSETRIHQRDRQGHVKYQPPKRRAASLQRVPGGPAMYGGGHQQRIYHSQQLAGLTPLYEVVDPRNGSVYDVYQIGGGSKTKLLQDSGKSGDRHSKSGKKMQRSPGDGPQDPAAKRPHRQSNKPSSNEPHRSSKTGSITRETAQVHAPRDKPKDGKEAGGGVDNVAFIGSSEKINEGGKDAPSATDSMKLLANNRTDDQKYVVSPPGSNSDTDTSSLQPTPVPVPDPDPTLHYTYGGDIYAVPDKDETKRRSRAENPILARMQDMILERAESYQPNHVQDPVTDLTENPEPIIVTSAYGGSPDQGASLIQNPIYQEVEDVGSETVSRVTDGEVSTGSGVVAAAVRSAVDEPDSGVGDSAGASGDVAVGDVAASSVVTSLRDAGASGVGELQKEESGVVKGALETRWSTDTDAATDEISRAGKHISVTAEAFEFLDTYLSDEDGGDIQSPPKSPVLSGRDDDMMY